MARLSNLNSKFTFRSYLLLLVVSLGLVGLWTFTLIADTTETSDHIGIITAQQLLENYPQFEIEYSAYEPTDAEIEQMAVLQDKEVTVLFGTWCHDSQREVPRLLKLLDSSGVELTALTLYGVDRKKNDPDGVAQSHKLQFTPTLIVSSQGEEITRIVEKPKVNLAADFVSQLSQE